MKTKTITFIPSTNRTTDYFDPPVSAVKVLPEWYKQQPAHIGGEFAVSETGTANITVKKCMPVLDDMTAGYIISTCCDLFVKHNPEDPMNGPKNISWSLQTEFPTEIISTHSTEQISHFPVPMGYNVFPFKFNNFWRIKTPKGYSCMFRHPFYHSSNQPFYSLSGIVDTDTYPQTINFPFLIHKEFEGIIPMGTPIIQLIPFKRVDWESVVSEEDNSTGVSEFNYATRKWMHRYKDNWRVIKSWK